MMLLTLDFENLVVKIQLFSPAGVFTDFHESGIDSVYSPRLSDEGDMLICRMALWRWR